MVQDAFFARLHEAEEAGLNKEAALEVAYKLITLDEALGEMDMDQESQQSGAIIADPATIMNDCDCGFDPSCPRCFPF
ncbi:putative cytosine DNA methylase [Pseudomonas phage Motto]|nr:putative cytosine DNA methylase [Pseudomonas phage Motto]